MLAYTESLTDPMDAMVTSLARQMSRPENQMNGLSWRRLHLSRAKLKASARTSALLSGFAMVAMVEMQVSASGGERGGESAVPLWLLVAFAVCTTLLVSIHMLALMISTCILPHVEAVASLHGFAAVNESPHERMHLYIEIAWAFSTVFGIFLFLIELAILFYVKFWEMGSKGRKASLAAVIILVPIGVIFIAFAVHFYRTLVSHKFERSERGLQELESMITQLHNENQYNTTAVNQMSPTVPNTANILNV
ncbi:unnamed protein product [Medioppia subpectinata]|uniref:Calcium release-activated calcium channel protein 1 n=1 Tax=Medioppia subpectinata TaxID=1979941 RepID=A0A7R9KN44_9ACAR|nr:unnamed protein product [Medioppia subpectinata]CAG2106314.1 unnamed protein product [Medioppia subpectinata]